MGNWIKQQNELKDARERDKLTKEIFSKFFLDLAKLVFAAIVLEGFSPMFMDVDRSVKWEIIVAGAIAAFALSLLGYKTIKTDKLWEH